MSETRPHGGPGSLEKALGALAPSHPPWLLPEAGKVADSAEPLRVGGDGVAKAWSHQRQANVSRLAAFRSCAKKASSARLQPCSGVQTFPDMRGRQSHCWTETEDTSLRRCRFLSRTEPEQDR